MIFPLILFPSPKEICNKALNLFDSSFRGTHRRKEMDGKRLENMLHKNCPTTIRQQLRMPTCDPVNNFGHQIRVINNLLSTNIDRTTQIGNGTGFLHETSHTSDPSNNSTESTCRDHKMTFISIDLLT